MRCKTQYRWRRVDFNMHISPGKDDNAGMPGALDGAPQTTATGFLIFNIPISVAARHLLCCGQYFRRLSQSRQNVIFLEYLFMASRRCWTLSNILLLPLDIYAANTISLSYVISMRQVSARAAVIDLAERRRHASISLMRRVLLVE